MRTGVDIIENKRIKKIMDKNEKRFLSRIFTHNEIEYIINRNKDFKTVAGLFAAKEAMSKMVGTGIGRLSWHDIEISHKESGRPYVIINANLEAYLKELDLSHIDISISHEREYSIAFAIGY